MFFYIDESGQTGHNLFDKAQPILFYGVLSSQFNVSLLAEPALVKLRKLLGVDRLHANELGNENVAAIGKELCKLQKKYDLRFDFYRVMKTDYALMSFFDQVFDQGVNPAITWTAYWTPLRYVLLLKLATLFDEDTLQKAWQARVEKNDGKAETALSEICKTIKSRVGNLPDQRSRELIYDTLDWAENNPSEICYNRQSKESFLQISPNLIGFQFVLQGVGNRLAESGQVAEAITVDQQHQFNKSQQKLVSWYLNAKEQNTDIEFGFGLPEVNFNNIPETTIDIKSGNDCAGLELVDLYLWVFKRVLEGKEVPEEIKPLVKNQINCGWTDEISLDAIAKRWEPIISELPEPTPDQLTRAKSFKAIEEARRIKASP